MNKIIRRRNIHRRIKELLRIEFGIVPDSVLFGLLKNYTFG